MKGMIQKMLFKPYNDVKEFYKDTFDVLKRHEAENIIPLGNVIIGNEGKDKTAWRDPVNWFMATVSDAGGIVLTAIMTPPHNITIYATDNKNDAAALLCLMDGIKENGIHIPGVMAEKSLAELFADLYTKKNGLECTVEVNQRIYELTEVSKDIQKIGVVRLLTERDLSFLPYWMKGFQEECGFGLTNISADIEEYRHQITQNRVFILEDNGTPVTMAKITREMVNVCAVAMVYTPPYFRGRGYATSCVAATSQAGLDKGFKKCVLYTDLANPISNSIYMKIGYKPICDSVVVKFK